MDDRQFDTLIRALAAGITRRGALGLLAGLAGFEWADAAAAKRRNRKKNKGRVAAQKQGDKVTVCHHTSSATNPVVEITISPSAVAQHIANHGDSVKGDCCVDSECARLDDQCNVGRCVVDDDDVSTCQPVPTRNGEACDDEDPCTRNDQCRNGACVGQEIRCQDDGNVCTREFCRGGECVSEPLTGGACDDGDRCTNNDRCRNGECVGEPVICPVGQACIDGECIGCVGEDCAGIVFGCDDDPGCVCFLTQERTGFCHRGEPCAGLQSCTSSADCPPDHPACSLATCCGPAQGPVCIRPCAGTGAGLAAAAADGPTTTGQ